MSAQLTYDQSPAIGFAGMIAESFTSPKHIDSGLAESVNQVTTSVIDFGYIADNVVVVTLDGVALPSVTFIDTSDNMSDAIAAVIAAQSSVASAVHTLDAEDKTTITFNDYASHTVSFACTGGAGQPNYTIALVAAPSGSLVLGAPLVNGTEDAQYKVAADDTDPVGVAIYVSGSEQAYSTGVINYADKVSFPIMKKGRFYGVAGSALAKGASVSYHVANGKYVADGAGTTNAFVTTVTSSAADGDIIVLEIHKV